MTARISYEAERFGRTGPGFACLGLRYDFVEDALTYALDAPVYIARGSVSGYLQSLAGGLQQHYIGHTIASPVR